VAFPRFALMYSDNVMTVSLGQAKPVVKGFINPTVYSVLNMDATRKSRLQKLITGRYAGVQDNLAKAAGLSKGRISQLLDPDQRFGESAARTLEAKLLLPERWFDAPEVENTTAAPDIQGGVPLISWVQAGSWNEAADPLQLGEAEAWVVSIKATSPRAYALRVRGDSMTAPHGKSYPEGSIIIVEPERKAPINGERIIAKLDGSAEVTFKVYKEEDGRRWLQPLNPTHEPIRQPFRVLGTVIGKWEEE
jgi:SOS-response transcriptional repressor LexA